MGRETDEEREARLRRAGTWLLAELKSRGWSQRHLAEQLGVSQQQVSAYVLGRHQFDSGLVPDLARLFGMEEEDVWRNMRIPLPGSFRTDDEVIAYARRRWPRSMAAAMQEPSGAKNGTPGVNTPTRPLSGGNVPTEPRGEQPAV